MTARKLSEGQNSLKDNRTRQRPRSAKALLCALVLAALAAGTICRAQDDVDDNDNWSDTQTAATLTLRFDKDGSVKADLSLPEAPPSREALGDALARGLHCPGGKLQNGVSFEAAVTSFSAKWSAEQREKYLAAMQKAQQKMVEGSCTAVLAKHDGVFEGDIDYRPLAAELAKAGMLQLNLYVVLPESEYRDYTKVWLKRQYWQAKDSLTYVIPTKENSANQAIHVAYGLRRVDVYRAWVLLAGFLFLPLAITLGMRRMAMSAPDPILSRFQFFRRMNFLVTGAMLLWTTSGLGFRQALRDGLEQAGLPGWQVTAGDVLILVGPVFVIYFLCIAVSYPVYAQVRSGGWSRREYLVQQSTTMGAWALPLMLGLAALAVMHDHVEVSVVLGVGTLVMAQVLVQLKVRVTKQFPQAVTTGALHERILALAGRMGVQVKQVLVLPSGKGQVANAYASHNKRVLFTDYLLEQLSKREVDATTAHELAHLRHRHPIKRWAAFLAGVFLPAYFSTIFGIITGLLMIPIGLARWMAGLRVQMEFFQAMEWFEQWPQRDFVLIMLGLTGFYFLSRRFENQADETAVRVAGDPEAAITGLLKLSRLNYMPIRFGKWETWLTHPSTAKRVERIAAFGGLAPARLQEILQQHDAAVALRAPEARVVADDRYAIPVTCDADRIRSMAKERAARQLLAWLFLALHVLPLVAVAKAVELSRLEGWAAMAAYGAGVVCTAVLTVPLGVWLGSAGKAARKERLLRRFAADGLPVGKEGDVLVGFAPEAYPRLYGIGNYHWDAGFLVLAQDRLQFVGEQAKFSLTPAEVESIVLGAGGPSWWKFERIYVKWKAGERGGVFNLYTLDPTSMWKVRREMRQLCQRLQTWQQQPHQQAAVRPELARLEAPKLAEVKSLSPAELGSFSIFLRTFGKLLLLALWAGILLRGEIAYLCAGVFWIKLFQCIPYWRYRDRPPAFSLGLDSSKALGASASGHKSS